ncbi:hypothetical protein GYB22_03135 [bacterium]|nr:hypothetical protein [bacterium]
MKFILSMLPLLFVALLIGCDSKPTYQLKKCDQFTLDYTVFQEGSWWEYINVSTSELDTVTISKYELTRLQIDESGFELELHEMQTKWSHFDYEKNKKLSNSFSAFDSDILQGSRNLERVPEDEIELITIHTFPDSVSSLVLNPPDSLTLDQKLDSITVQGVKYRDVIVISNSFKLSARSYKTIYWAPHVGKIKFITHDNQIYELKSKNIIQ